jgi:hypothetical protein
MRLFGSTLNSLIGQNLPLPLAKISGCDSGHRLAVSVSSNRPWATLIVPSKRNPFTPQAQSALL